VKVFDDAVLLVLRTSGWYGQDPPVLVAAKYSDVCPCFSL
jgi:hypothetical protein